MRKPWTSVPGAQKIFQSHRQLNIRTIMNITNNQMKQLYTLNSDIASVDKFLEVYNKSIKTDNLLKDLCNILFIDPRLYVYYTIKKYVSGAVRLYSIEYVVDYMWNFVNYTDDFSGKIQDNRYTRVDNILHARKQRTMDPEVLTKCKEVKQRIIASFKDK